MRQLFKLWKAFSWKIVNALLVVIGAFTMLGAANLMRLDGPILLSIVSAVVGVVLFGIGLVSFYRDPPKS